VPPVYTRSGTHQNKLVRFLAHSAWPPERPVRILLAWLTMMRRMGEFADRFFRKRKSSFLAIFTDGR